MSFFKRSKTLAEIQEEDELAAANLSLTKKRAMIYRLERQKKDKRSIAYCTARFLKE